VAHLDAPVFEVDGQHGYRQPPPARRVAEFPCSMVWFMRVVQVASFRDSRFSQSVFLSPHSAH
jgi:hypothetical protein